MTFNSPPVSPLGLAQAARRASTDGTLHIVAHNGADIFGGAERVLINLLHGLQQRGHQVTLCCNHDIVADAAVRRLVPSIVLPLRGDLLIGDALRFARFLKRDRPDALLLGTFKKIWLGGLAARRAGVERTVARVGLASDTPRRLKYRYALNRFIDTVVLNANAMRDRFLAQAGGYDPSRVITIYNGITPPPGGRDAGNLRAQLHIPANAHVIGTVARLARQKRLERLVEATARLDGVHCIIAGDGSEREALEHEMRKHKVESRVHLIGPREDLAPVHNSLDLFVVTSDQEGMSNAMLEALWSGVPVVSTPVSGAAEALEPMSGGQAPGRVTTGFTVDEITQETRALLRDAGERKKMSVAAESRARDRFDFERMLDQWEAVLRGGSTNTR